MLDETKLKRILKELFDNDEEVPSDWDPRCSELDWFSSGIKNNIVAYIYKEMFGKDIAPIDDRIIPDSIQPTITIGEDGKPRVVAQKF